MKKITILLSVLLVNYTLDARDINKNSPERPANTSFGGLGQRVMANCTAPRGSKELWVNNVRTIIYTGGDMWWDLFGNTQAYYYVPAATNRATGVSSCFSGSIWLGGYDEGGQLKVAAMTYRQNGLDFWPGPLDITNASTDASECNRYDLIYSVSRTDVDNFALSDGAPVASADIRNWPGNGDVSKNQALRLAPFVDGNNDGLYDPTGSSPKELRDYPAYDVNNRAEKDNLGFCKTKLFGDFTLFWVFNDKGNIHTETQGKEIGVEVRAQAFAFKTNDEINNMTFYSYEVHNRSSFQLNRTYFTVWNDADLGYYLDDYVGCDVKRGLGYIYNANQFDPTIAGANGYGDFPPALGCDFFKGPLADANDKLDNDQDGQIDELGETIQMSRFTYYNNNYGAFPDQTTNPTQGRPIHYYNYMTGFWKDGSQFTFGGNAYGGSAPATFVYDGDPVKGTGWTERGSGNPAGDRRFLQSAGPFTLKPGAVNEITFGMPWAQSPTKGGNVESLELLYLADDKAQALFDNCFKLLDGPEAPNITVQETNNELIIYLTNEKGRSNNYNQFNNDYAEEDISIFSDPTSNIPAIKNPDKTYRFEGYIVYQLRDGGISATDLEDATKAKPIFQSDIENGISRLVNYEVDNTVGGYVPKLKVQGADKGIRSTFRVTEDAFSSSENKKLINNKTYYFMAVAYAYNNYLSYAEDVSPSVNPSQNYLGQKKPFLAGRKVKKAAGIPHVPDSEKGGTITQSIYGFGPKITRVEGQGNGGNLLTLTAESENEIVNKFFKADVTYANAQGPLNIKVVDPLNIKNADFSFKFINQLSLDVAPTASQNAMVPTSTVNTFLGTMAALNINTTSWELKDLSPGGSTYHPNEIRGGATDIYYQTIKVGNEFYFPELGFSISVKQVTDPGQDSLNKFTDLTTLGSSYTGPSAGSLIGASVSYLNGTANWLNSVKDFDGTDPYNWILSGSAKTAGNEDASYNSTTGASSLIAFVDPQKQYGKILDGTWAPYSLCASYYYPVASTGGGFSSRIFCGPGFSGEAWKQDDYIATNYRPQPTTSIPARSNTDLRKLSSALIVFTKDKSKWTRCVVLEMQEKAQLSQGNAFFFSPRKHQSVDKEGKSAGVGSGTSNDQNAANFISETGMGWFPGYAINIETGERLNMAFGEDSYQKENRGDDMIWNPTPNYNFPYPYAMGGKHFVYVFGGNSITSKYYAANSFKWESYFVGKDYGMVKYDYGQRIMDVMKNFFTRDVFEEIVNGSSLAPFNALERDIMWVSIPMPKPEFSFSTPDAMPSDVRFQINVAKPYRYGYSGIANIPQGNQQYGSLNKLISVNSPSLLTKDVSATPQNNNFPMYTFNTGDIATLYNQSDVVKAGLDLIRVVPNPYYGSSSYETRRIDTRVRITNLPNKCTIKIFSMNGTLVRTIKRDVSGQEDIYTGSSTGGDDVRQAKRISYEDWDLKNQKNIEVASGLYIFHIDAPGVGEKIIKWFGVMRPLDVQSY